MAHKKTPQEEAYCVKCKKKVSLINARHETTKNGRPMVVGECPYSHNKCCKFIKKESAGGLYF